MILLWHFGGLINRNLGLMMINLLFFQMGPPSVMDHAAVPVKNKRAAPAAKFP
jgi:hypothetical protein